MPFITDHVQSEGRLQGSGLILDITSAAAAAATLQLTATSNTELHFSGTVAGQIVRLPDATSLRVGRYFRIWNQSTQNIEVQTFNTAVLRTIKADTVAEFLLLSNASAAGVWLHNRQLLTEYAVDTAETTTINTLSATDVLMGALTQTPPRGVYRVSYATSVVNTNNGTQKTATSIYVGGVQVVGTDVQTGNSGGAYNPISGNAQVPVNGSQAIEIRWRAIGNTSSALGRVMSVLRVD